MLGQHAAAADDALLVLTSDDQLQRLLIALRRACECWRLVIKVSKIKHLVDSPPKTQPAVEEVLLLGRQPVA